VTPALAIFSALVLALVFPSVFHPTGSYAVAGIALVPLIAAAHRETRAVHRFLYGWLAGAVFWAAVCPWIQFILEVHGGMGHYLSWFAYLLFALYKGLHLAVFTWLCGYFLKSPRAWTPIAIAALFTGIERTHGTFGFAWLTLGNSAIDVSGLARIAPVLGVYGITFVFALCAATIGVAFIARSWRPAMSLAAFFVLPFFPTIRNPAPPDRVAVLVQPNAPEEPPWTDPQWQVESAKLFRMAHDSAQSTADLVVVPEIPAPVFYFDDPSFATLANNFARESAAYVLLGTIARTPKSEPLNSSVLISPGGQPIGQYSKMNLVPFGEFVPSLFSWVNKITKEAGDYAPGTEPTVFTVGEHKLSTFICYESAFPDFVRSFANRGAELLVNISNDGYFGNSFAREQHLQLVRTRAIENNRWILRAVNDGITVSIDPAGRIVNRLPPNQQIVGRVPYAFVKETTLYSRHGDWFAWSCLSASIAAAAAIFALGRRR
jgi:apolipoprotein N-acyltransferase